MHIERGGNAIAAHAKENGKFIQKQLNSAGFHHLLVSKCIMSKQRYNLMSKHKNQSLMFKLVSQFMTIHQVMLRVSVSQKNSLQIDVINE